MGKRGRKPKPAGNTGTSRPGRASSSDPSSGDGSGAKRRGTAKTGGHNTSQNAAAHARGGSGGNQSAPARRGKSGNRPARSSGTAHTRSGSGASPPAPAGRGKRGSQSALPLDGPPVGDYRHDAKRKNNPPAKLAAEGVVPAIPKAQYAYNPHLPPVLRFDQTGQADLLETRLSGTAKARAEELLTAAQQRTLTPTEATELHRLLEAAAQARVAAEPWLEWTGKREKKWFEVDPVALHIHERVSAQAILRVAARQDVQRSLFADPQQEYHEAVQFYRHDVDWANRLILGDSLQVMSSLARREDLAGKVPQLRCSRSRPPHSIVTCGLQSQIAFVQRDCDRVVPRRPDKEKATCRSPRRSTSLSRERPRSSQTRCAVRLR